MTSDSQPILLVILGPTAAGKTQLSISIAKLLSAEILSADSRQFYREMKIGTASPSEEELAAVPHHFVGHLSIFDEYNVSKFESDALKKLDELFHSSRFAVMTGGSGLYIRAICRGIDDLPDPDPALRENLKESFVTDGIATLRNQLKMLDPVYYHQVDLSNPKRLLRALEVCITTGQPFSSLRRNLPCERNFRIVKIGLTREKEALNKRINTRVEIMMENGLEAEARELFPHRQLNALNTVGYKELFQYFDGALTKDKAIEKIKTNSRRYAKRQMTWFRKEEDIHWFDAANEEAILDLVAPLRHKGH